MSRSRPASTVHEIRIQQLEVAIHEIKNVIVRIDVSLEKLVALEVKHDQTKDGLMRCFARIEGVESVLNGRDGQPGLAALLATAVSKIENHTWALRTVAGALAMQLVAAMFYMLLER